MSRSAQPRLAWQTFVGTAVFVAMLSTPAAAVASSPGGSPASATMTAVSSDGTVWVFSAERLTTADLSVEQARATQTDSSTLAIPPQSPPPANWGSCGLFDASTKVVATYDRRRVGGAMSSANATLSCGNENTGYRHILNVHQSHWSALAAPVQINWRSLAAWSTDWVLYDPDYATYDASRSTWCYSRQVFLYKNGAPYYVSTPRVALNRTGASVITAFPASTQCQGVNQL